ncbi:MAG: Nramp family divalent metal transporter [Candidatus Peribacteraceae bacterium]|nr:Nramp family divalent metal transporter [Candidatus Peribacteraceae bacterium]
MISTLTMLRELSPPSDRRSLHESHSTVSVRHGSLWRRIFAFAGPAYMVSVGYMDPGNWATDIEGGSRFGYELLWVLLLSNVMALLLQTLAARMGIVGGEDLAQACRGMYGRGVRIVLWLLAELAIAACDLAEVIGTVIGLKLLFGLPSEWGILVTLFDTFLLLGLQRFGIRKIEAIIVTLVFTIGACFVIELFLAQPSWGDVFPHLLPTFSSTSPFIFSHLDALYIAVGIIGATVMPHNLYLHSALVQSRTIEKTTDGMKEACKMNLLDSFLALNAAFFVNAAILILAAAAFGANGIIVSSIEDAHRLLPQFLGASVAATLFAVALLCAGQSSTVTGTLAGQIVMEGFLSFRMRPWLRRLLTRMIAIVPAAAVILLVGDSGLMSLIVVSQVILGLQLPFAIIPLLQYTNDLRRMGDFVSSRWVRIAGWIIAGLITILNVVLITGAIRHWSENLIAAGRSPIGIQITLWPLLIVALGFLFWLVASPFIGRRREREVPEAASVDAIVGSLTEPSFRKIAVALEHSPDDAKALSHAAALARTHGAELVLIHVVDGVGAQWYGDQTRDEEERLDQAYIRQLTEKLRSTGLRVKGILRYGTPSVEIIAAIKAEQVDAIVLRAHGHGFIKDRVFGQTIDAIRHAVKIPVMAVR